MLELTDYTTQQLLRYERGSIRIYVDVLYHLNKIFCYQVDDFFEEILQSVDFKNETFRC